MKPCPPAARSALEDVAVVQEAIKHGGDGRSAWELHGKWLTFDEKAYERVAAVGCSALAQQVRW